MSGPGSTAPTGTSSCGMQAGDNAAVYFIFHVAEKRMGHPCLLLCNIAFTCVWEIDESTTNGSLQRHIRLVGVLEAD